MAFSCSAAKSSTFEPCTACDNWRKVQPFVPPAKAYASTFWRPKFLSSANDNIHFTRKLFHPWVRFSHTTLKLLANYLQRIRFGIPERIELHTPQHSRVLTSVPESFRGLLSVPEQATVLQSASKCFKSGVAFISCCIFLAFWMYGMYLEACSVEQEGGYTSLKPSPDPKTQLLSIVVLMRNYSLLGRLVSSSSSARKLS